MAPISRSVLAGTTVAEPVGSCRRTGTTPGSVLTPENGEVNMNQSSHGGWNRKFIDVQGLRPIRVQRKPCEYALACMEQGVLAMRVIRFDALDVIFFD